MTTGPRHGATQQPCRRRVAWWLLAALAAAGACGGPQASAPATGKPNDVQAADADVSGSAVATRPPPAGTPRDIRFPEIAQSQLESGLEINVVHQPLLPLQYLRVVIQSGGADDPSKLAGLANVTASMLKEGTRTRSSKTLAEEIEYLGAELSVGADEDNVFIMIRSLSEHMPQAMSILADVVMHPAFSKSELAKLKRREIDRLAVLARDPDFIAKQAFYRHLYDQHPYARIEATPDAVKRMQRSNLARWHRKHFVASNAFFVSVGAVPAEDIVAAANKAFGRWSKGSPPRTEYGSLPERGERQIVLVDRPGSAQSVILVGNLALRRSDKGFLALEVANQVLGGSSASRLFMDLREKRSLTYGAYSDVGERIDIGPFVARTSVRTEVTGQALTALLNQLEAIRSEPAPERELADAHRYLTASLPLKIETPARVASRIAYLRIFGLPNDYWNLYGERIRSVSSEAALAAARQHIRPDQALVVVVGDSSAILSALKEFGDVQVVSGESASTS